MVWWDWGTGRRISLMGAMLCLAAAPWIVIGVATSDWRGFGGGTGFLFIPQFVAWVLFVGLKTGRMPSAYGGSELRDASPAWFWLTGAAYVVLILFFIFIILSVVLLGSIPGL